MGASIADPAPVAFLGTNRPRKNSKPAMPDEATLVIVERLLDTPDREVAFADLTMMVGPDGMELVTMGDLIEGDVCVYPEKRTFKPARGLELPY